MTPGLTPDEAHTAIAAHLRAQGYELIDAPPTPEQRRAHSASRALRTGQATAMRPPRRRSTILACVASSASCARPPTTNCASRRCSAAACPSRPIGDVLHTPFVIVPIVNADNNQHAPNENIRMREFRRGVELYAALLAEGGGGELAPLVGEAAERD